MYQGEPDITGETKAPGTPHGTERVRVWPDLVLRETIAALVAVILLLVLSSFVDAPLEGIADPSYSMNPSKAPWYFLGLQELLVYFTPWIAGVAIPVVIITGLMAIPYVDVGGKAENDSVVFVNEKQIRWLFSVGLCIWVVLTVIGLYFRGPNWGWQWPGAAIVQRGHNINLNWLVPVVTFLYLAWALLKRMRHRIEGGGKNGFIRHFFPHLLTIMGLTVTIKIAVYNILDFILQ